jgi:uncharacterized protein YndB with AHSA1/START domain
MSETSSETRSVVVERSLPHPPEKVWRALSEGDLMARWMMPNDFQPVVGHRFTFRAPPMPQWDGIVNCEVLEIEPPRRLVIRWGVGGDGPGALVTTAAFTVTPEPGGAHLRIEQSGFTPEQENNRRGAQFGLTRMAESLTALLEEI